MISCIFVEFHSRIYESQAIDQRNDLFEDALTWFFTILAAFSLCRVAWLSV